MTDEKRIFYYKYESWKTIYTYIVVTFSNKIGVKTKALHTNVLYITYQSVNSEKQKKAFSLIVIV